MQNIELQGGNAKTLLEECGKRRSPYMQELKAEQTGYIKSINAFDAGMAGVHLGVGRNKTSDSVCPDAGMEILKHAGDKVTAGDIIMKVYGKDEACFDAAMKLLKRSITYSAEAPERHNPILKVITQNDIAV